MARRWGWGAERIPDRFSKVLLQVVTDRTYSTDRECPHNLHVYAVCKVTFAVISLFPVTGVN